MSSENGIHAHEADTGVVACEQVVLTRVVSILGNGGFGNPRRRVIQYWTPDGDLEFEETCEISDEDDG